MKDVIHIGKIINLSEYGFDQIIGKSHIKLTELENKDITILSIEHFTNNKYNKKGVKAKILIDGKEKFFSTTAKIIVKQLIDIRAKYIANSQELPNISCKVVKENGAFKLI